MGNPFNDGEFFVTFARVIQIMTPNLYHVKVSTVGSRNGYVWSNQRCTTSKRVDHEFVLELRTNFNTIYNSRFFIKYVQIPLGGIFRVDVSIDKFSDDFIHGNRSIGLGSIHILFIAVSLLGQVGIDNGVSKEHKSCTRKEFHRSCLK